MPQIGAKSSPGVELLEIIQMEPLGKFKNNHNGNAKGGGVKDGNSWRRSHTGNMSEQDVDDVAFLTGPDSQSSRLARERAAYGGSNGGGGGRAVAVCSQRRALVLACSVLVVLLAAALVLAYAGPQAECGCAGEPPPGTKKGVGRPTPSPIPRLAVGGTPYPWAGARLPNTAEPIRYTLWLHPNLTTHEVKGEVIIEFHIEKETNFVVLNARELNITDKMVTGPKGHAMKIVRFLEYKPADQIYFEIKDKFRKRANYTLSLRYNTKLSKKLRGFFISDYLNADGEKKQLAATNFGLTHARSAFPCFDEPQLKAKFKITIVRDRFHVSLTNMPIAATEEAGFYLGHRLLQDDFQESPEMSTYLVGLVVCEFARSAALAPRGTSVSVYADTRHNNTAHSILQNAVAIIDRYENFLNVTFPLPKLDMVIMEGLEDTAEGWGLLGIGSTLLPDKKYLEKLLAHQWLGGLVTPKWWGSRWLTEGLVALLQHAPRESPSVEDDTLLLEHTVPALKLDALPTAHPVSMSVQDPEDIEAVQDDLSYHKGAALVGMAWSAAGSGARLALRDFLSQHARSAADPRDLWRLLGRKARADLQVVMESWTEQAGYPLLTLSRDGDMVTVKQERFLLLGEVPQKNLSIASSLLALELSLEGLVDPSSDVEILSNTTELRGIIGDIQSGVSDKPEPEKTTTTPPPPKEVKESTPQKKEKSKYRYKWYVPLTYILGPMENITNGTDTNSTTTDDDKANITATTPIPKSGNGRKSDLKNMKQSPVDRNVQNSTQKPVEPQKLTKAKSGGEMNNNGNGSHLIWMNMTEVKFRVPANVSWIKLNVGGRGLYRANYPETGWKALKKALSTGALSSPGDRASLIDDAFTLSRAGLLNASVALGLCEYLGTSELARAPWLAALSHLQRWTFLLAGAAAGTPLRRYLAIRLVAPAVRRALAGQPGAVSGELVEAAVEFELPDAVEAAKKMFDDWADNNITIATEYRQAAYSAGVRHGSEDAWMKCWKAYKRSADPAEREALLAAMATTQDHWLLNRYLQATLDSKLVAPSDVKIVLSATARRQPGRLLAWRHLRSRPAPPPPELLEAVAEHMASPDDFKEISEFYADIDVGPALNRSLETIALNVAWVGKNERDLLKYLSQVAETE